jgi:FdhE protein
MPETPDRERLQREAERRWTRLEREHPELAPAIAAGRGIVGLYIDYLPPAPPLDLTPEAVRDKLRSGTPLLADESLDFDPAALRRFFAAACAWASTRPDHADDGARLVRAVADEGLDAETVLALALTEDDAGLAEAARRLAVGVELLRALARFLVSAALIPVARALAPAVARDGSAWDRAICPICGAPPLLAEQQGTEGQRVLRCAVCGAGWRFARNRCPGCATDEPGAQHFLAVEGREEKYRVDLCDNCRGYLKSCTAFAATPPELLALEDIALLHLAEAARERGYHPIGSADVVV